MARGRRGGASRARAPARPAMRRAPASQPARAASTSTPAPMQPQQSSGGGMLSGIGSTIAQGMAFGTGSAIAHRAVGAAAGAMSGGGSEAQQQPMEVTGGLAEQQTQSQQQLQGACAQDKQMFFECLQINRGDQQACSFLYDTLQTCQREQNQMQYS